MPKDSRRSWRSARPSFGAASRVRGWRLSWALAVALVACSGPGAAHYVGLIDELGLPEEWEAARTVIYAPDGDVRCEPSLFTDCPYAVRYYLADGAPADVYAGVLAAVRADGFESRQEFDPSCDHAGELPCGFSSVRADDRINVAIYQPGQDDGVGVARPDLVTVRVTAQETD